MYGAPPESSFCPTSITRADVIALEAHRRAGLAKKSLDRVLVAKGLSSRTNLMVTSWSSCSVARRDYDAHTSHAEDPLDTAFSGEQIALPDGGSFS